jgi:hypothetical protein
MLFFIAALAVQGLLVFECLLRRVLGMLLPSTRSALGRYTDKSVVAAGVSGASQLLALPLQMLATLVNVSVSVLAAAALVVLVGVALSESSRQVLALVVGSYNQGVAPAANVLLEMSVVLNNFLRFLLPIYNAIVFLPSMFVSRVLKPLLWTYAEILPEIIANASLSFTALVMSFVTYVQNLSTCATETVKACPGRTCGAQFVAYDVNCIANPAFLSLDLMTPGVYLRRVMFGVQQVLQDSCAAAALLFNIVIYPTLDFNLYKALHCLANMPLYGTVSLVLGTIRRCELLRAEGFNDVELAVGCTPDFLPVVSVFVEALRALGRLVDNWLNVVTDLALTSISGKQSTCAALGVAAPVQEAAQAFGVSAARVRVAGLTETTLAITDGVSAMYRSASTQAWAVFAWPMPVRVTNGVAGVQASLAADGDDAGEARSGLLGCECIDTSVGIELACATIPLLGAGLDTDARYNASHIHNVRFDAVRTDGMTCARTLVRVAPMRWSRRRASVPAGGGRDVDQFDPYGTLGGSRTQVTPFTVDAAIYVQPLCGDAGPTCLPLTDSCYPWCMGLHVAGLGAQNISIFNAVRWEEYVSVRQTDCGVELDNGRVSCAGPPLAAAVETLQDGQVTPARCGLQAGMCVSNDNVVSSIAVQAYASEDHTLAAQKTSTGPVQRTSAQPFVLAGDVLLTHLWDEQEIVVSRLYDAGGGVFGVGEELTLVRNKQRVEVRTCPTLSDNACHSRIASEGRVVAPTSYFDYDNGARVPAASSQWAVHWAINPELSVLSAVYDFCYTGQGTTSVIIASSWAPARVWTLKTMRAVDMYGEPVDGNAPESAVAYMVVPGFQSASSLNCNQWTSLRVVALEYLNKDNVLVTVLEGRPRDVDPATGDVCETCEKRYRYFYLNPERHDCVEPGDGDGAHFSCWREDEPWSDPDSTVAFGLTCPAAERMPPLGSAVAELVCAALFTVRLVLDTLCVVPAAIAGGGWPGLAAVMQPRLGRPTMHSMLDTTGTNFLGVEEIIRSMQRAMLYAAASLTRVAGAFDGRPGAQGLQNVLIGTAKVLQHSDGLVALGDPITKQLDAVRQLPSVTTLASVGDGATGAAMPLPLGLPSTTRLFVTFSSVLSLNLRLLRRVLVRLLRATSVADALSGIFLAAVYESKDDFDTFLDTTRMQCHGLGEVLGGTNPFARTVRQACQLGPDGVDFVLAATRVVFVDYAVMSCACKLGQGETENTNIDVLSAVCLSRFSPAAQQRWMLGLLFVTDNVQRRDLCFAAMDGANARLLAAMDPFLARTYRIAESVAEGLDYIITVFTADRSGCNAYLLSPYVLSLIPEPVDYFMGCMHTPDCRTKCLAEYAAFDARLLEVQGGGPPLEFAYALEIDVESNLFDPYDVQNSRHKPHFELFAVLELDAACVDVCSNRVRGRCIAVTGRYDSAGVGLAYYCLPADVTMFVFEYESPAPAFVMPVENVVDMMLLSGFKAAGGDWVLVVEEDDLATTALIAVPGLRSRTELFRTGDAGNFRVGYVKTVTAIRVRPAMAAGDTAHVLVLGKRRDGDAWVEACAHFRLDVSDPTGNLVAMSVTATECTSAAAVDPKHRPVCLDPACRSELLLPAGLDSRASVTLRTWPDEWASGAPRDTDYDIKSQAFAIMRTLGADVMRPVYQIDGRAARRRALLSPFSSGRAGLAFELLACNAAGEQDSWINVVHLRLTDAQDGTAARADASSSRSTRERVTVNIKLECSIDSCTGCQGDADLLARCYAAQECGVARCAGTLVNMRKPLCSLGQIAAQNVHLFRITLGGLWQAIAQQIVLFVELSEARRAQYEIAWPEEAFVAAICQTKDVTVQLAATFTSLAGAIGLAEHKRRENDVSLRHAAVDSRAHARFIMTLTATTNLLASALLFPVYSALCARKVMSCAANDAVAVFSDVFGAKNAEVSLFLGSRRLDVGATKTLGMCMGVYEKQMLSDVARADKTVATRMQDFFTGVVQLAVRTYLQASTVIFDGVIAYLLGVVTAIQDVIATVDWRSCRLPEISTSNVGTCACGDHSYRIPAARRRLHAADGAFWCSGLMLLTAVDGSDLLIWNPFSLDELLATAGLAEFIACLADPASGRCEAPVRPEFQQQGAELMQVVSRCRSNYQRSRWDDAAVLYALFEPADWSAGQLSSAISDNEYAHLRLRILALARTFNARVPLSAGTWNCLLAALKASDTMHRCHEQAIGHREQYFAYERAATDAFTETDACRVFTGFAGTSSTVKGASYAPYVWSADSRNKVPVALLHAVDEPDTVRVASVEQQLLDIAAEVRTLFARITPERLKDDLKVRAFSVEGDQLHQLVDCVVLGPYAAAEVPAAVVTPDGTRTSSSLYHRGEPESRRLHVDSSGSTQGSSMRRAVIAAARKHIGNSALDSVVDAATLNFERVRRLFLDGGDVARVPRNMLCSCANGGASLACCVEYDDRADIAFGARDFFDDTLLDLQGSVLDSFIDSLVDSPLLREDIWTTTDFAPPVEPIDDNSRTAMHSQQVFNASHGAYSYTRDEVRTHLGGETLWTECVALLQAPFFTLPLRARDAGDHEWQLDADFAYDPHESPDGYMHAVERAVAKVLSRAREDSPVFWSHVHRYVASDSVWCEDMAGTPTPAAEPATAHPPSTFMNDTVYDDIVNAPSLAQTVFPAGAMTHCFCGWSFDGKCAFAATLCSVSGGAAWTKLCSENQHDGWVTYTTREQLAAVASVLRDQPLDADWRRTCDAAEPSTLLGLLSADDTRKYFAGGASASGIDMRTVASHGPAGIRLAHVGTSHHSLWEHARSNATGARAINTARAHTIGQPVCRGTLNLPDSLADYFVDVFFPMAHTVHAAPAKAACSRWVVEYAVLVALSGLVDDEALAAQNATTGVWRTRCEAQLRQVGACALRGVFDFAPAEARSPYPGCTATVSADCGEVLFYTPNCLVRCGAEFYDPCACNSDCRLELPCTTGRINHHTFTDVNTDVKLLSMRWPVVMLEAETHGADAAELEAALAAFAGIGSAIDYPQLYNDLAATLIAEPAKVEGHAPEAYCDDLFDYWDPAAQHPVGYHPSMACSDAETNVRGFDAWMSADAGGVWGVDPMRLRDPDLAATAYGASNLVCDAAVYGADAVYWNDLHLNSRWPKNARADPTVPIHTDAYDAEAEAVEGVPSGDPADTPLVDPTDSLLAHSVGLVRDWLHASTETDAVDRTWPHWGSEWLPADDPNRAFSDAYASAREQSVCAPPLLRQCFDDDACGGLRCRRNGAVGVCMREDTCSQHAHCPPTQMCAGSGVCVDPHVSVDNRGSVKIAVQLHARQCSGSAPSSHFQHVRNFTRAAGLCKFRNWHAQRELAQHAQPGSGSLKSVAPDTTVLLSDEDADATAADFMRQTPHPCDRSYHTDSSFPLCIDTDTVRAVNEATGVAAPAYRVFSVSDATGNVRTCNLDSFKAHTGFLDPYVNFVDGKDNLLLVQSTVRRCWEFRTCPKSTHRVQGQTVQRRQVLKASVDAGRVVRGGVRDYCTFDTERCWGGAYLVGDSCSDAIRDQEQQCVTDLFIAPMVVVVFGQHDLTGIGDGVDSDAFITKLELPARLTEIQGHCPRAFTDVSGVDPRPRMQEFFDYLVGPINTMFKETVTELVNELLPSVFGVSDVSASDTWNFNTNLGEQVEFLDRYFEAARCASWVTGRLAELQGHFSNSYAFEARETGIKPLNPGTSLYVIVERMPVYVPFSWLWNCGILGRADKFWLQLMSSGNEVECRLSPAPDIGSRLLMDDRLWTRTFHTPVLAMQVVEDIENLIYIALYRLDVELDSQCIDGIFLAVKQFLFENNGGDRIEGETPEDNWYSWTVKQMTEAGILETRSLTDTVDSFETEFAYLRFKRLHGSPQDILVEFNRHFQQQSTSCTRPTDKPPLCTRLYGAECKLHEQFFESLQERGPDGDNYAFSTQATVFVLLSVKRDMREAPSFAGSEFNIVPDHIATQRLRDTGARVLFDTQTHIREAVTFNDFMRSKRFECQETDYESKANTNMLHQRLEKCVDEMQSDGGWLVDANAAARIQVSWSVLAGFFLSFTEYREGDRWLAGLFNDDVAMLNAENNAVCYMTTRGPQVINPYWAGDFDIDTGCDTSLRGGSRFVDVKCRPRFSLDVERDDTTLCSKPLFDSYDDAIKTVESAHCLEDDRTVVLRLNMGSLADGETPLCQREPPQPTLCTRVHGALHGYVGDEADDLTRTGTGARELVGIWDSANDVFRGRPDTASELLAIRQRPNDIAGHSLVFRLTDAAGLRLRCLNLAGEHSGACDHSVREWLAQVESEWERQHVFLRDASPSTARTGVSWHCPLQWVSAYAGLGRPYAARTPDRERNVVRFAHITNDAFYAHPSVASVDVLEKLRPARFMSEFWACVSADTSDCHGIVSLQETVAALRKTGTWRAVRYDQDSLLCARVLDWPHEAYMLRDRTTRSAGLDEREECNVYSRLPRFALSLARGAVRVGPSLANSTGGACHMGRLPRITASLVTDADLQRCARRDGRLRCVALRGGQRETVDFEFAPGHAPVHAPRRRRCRACAAGQQHHYVNARGVREPLSAPRKMLSTGEQLTLSPERALAADLRRRVCGGAAECPRLAEVFDTTKWYVGDFLQALLRHQLRTEPVVAAPAGPTIDASATSALWARPWVFCTRSGADETCSGTIARETWVDPNLRLQACATSIKASPLHSSNVRIAFCLLNDDTRELCARAVDWRDRIAAALCRAAGVCPSEAHFYSPTAYSLSNQEFAHDTVTAYYTGLGAECPAAATTTADQSASNRKLLEQCAANALERVRVALQGLREIKERIMRVYYYTVSIAVYILNLFVSAVTGQLAKLRENAALLVKYCLLWLDSIIDIIQELFTAFAQVIFGGGRMEAIYDLIIALCKIMEFIYREIIQAYICDIFLKIISAVIRTIASVVGAFAGLDRNAAKTANNIKNFADALENNAFCTVDASLGCDSMLPEPDDPGPDTLPVSTRCWSAYVTFFGDTQQLSCTRADTCKRSLVDNSLVMCGACPAGAAGFRDFGCSAVTKQCTCNVPALSETRCTANADCAAAASCRYLDEELAPSTGFVECAACQQQRFCLVPKHADVGFCACGLADLPYAECATSELGLLVAPPFARPCLYEPSPRFARARDFTTTFGQALTAPCQDLDRAYCMRVSDIKTFWVVGVNTAGRRLLSAAGKARARLV